VTTHLLPALISRYRRLPAIPTLRTIARRTTDGKPATEIEPHIHGGPKYCTPTVSQQIVLQCVPIKLFLLDLSATRCITQAYNILNLSIYILSVKYSMHSVI